MAIQIALFRGINVGKAKRVAMADLRTLLEELGFTRVRTLLNSGNAVFEAGRRAPAANATRIAAALAERTGVTANVLVITVQELDAAIAGNPFAARIDDPSRMLLGFFGAKADRTALRALADTGEDCSLGAHAFYLWCRHGILEDKVANALVGARFRDAITTRNWATACKLQALAKA
ncbi:DUF1697 domain-containing protein [Luteimonas aquatica]|uniref:DUF1697 domain-containing protein n=1 Tax=Luteimonas aquatica TaxID=450364 RepID=UPI001F56E9E4|nr:DUF1697 domain-containing protein [Luteimonas aquatica]